MGVVSIDYVKAGMILACDLYGPNGRFLLPEGAVLQDKHIRVAKIWGVVEADIQGVQEDKEVEEPRTEIPPEIIEQSKKMVMERFSLNDTEHEAVRELCKLSVAHAARRILFNGGRADFFEFKAENFEDRDLENLKTPPSAYNLVKNQFNLVSFPEVYFKIVDVLNNPRSSSSHIAEVVSKDASLSAKLLKLVNSPFYGFPSKIDTIERAVTLIGVNELTTLALGISVVSYFKDVPPEVLDMKSFWRHCIACGVYGRILAQQKMGLSEERYFVAGLLHDIGRLVMLKQLSGHMADALRVSMQEKITLQEAEIRCVGYDHSKIAGFIFKEWKLPLGLEHMVKFHHSPDKAINLLEPSIIHLADIMANALCMGFSGSFYIPRLQERAWDALDFSPSVLSAAYKQGVRQVDEIEQVFFNYKENPNE